jgi:arylsulfatase A-like enzyme/Flp pilus assembly protein TadD
VHRGRNILLITLDTLRWDYLSCYDETKAQTPNIDALAARGVLFEQAVVQVPLTLPSHASILTGTYPQVHQVRDIGGFVLDKKIPTIATVARSGGLKTAAFIGAAVLHHRFQIDSGFDHYNDNMAAVAEEDKLPGVVAELRAEVVTNRAIEWIKEAVAESGGAKSEAEGFLVWAHYYDPHRPYDPPEPYKSQYSKDPYAGESAYTDAQVGRLLEFLRDSGLEEDTLVVLLSDHGESLGEHGEFTHGVFLYESTMHVPLIIAGPGVLEGRKVSQQVRSIDVMPTIADYLGVPAGEFVQGVSLMPALEEGKGVRTTYSYMETLYPNTHMAWAELRGVRTEEWKLILSPKPELFKLETDPTESENVIKRFPADADRLQKQVWAVAGPPDSLGTIDYQPLDEESRAELNSLGYVSAGIRREIRIDMSGPDPKDRVDVLGILESAGEHMNNSRFSEAATELNEVLNRDQTNPLIYQHLILCYARLGQLRKALEVANLAIQNAAETDETYAEMGEIYIRLGELPTAAQVMEKSAERNPTNLQNFTNLATVYLQLQQLSDAERVITAVLTQADDHAAAYNLRGILEIQRGDNNAARQDFEKAVSYDPNLSEPYMNLGILAQESGDLEKALNYFREYVKRASPTEDREIVSKVRSVIRELERSIQSG